MFVRGWGDMRWSAPTISSVIFRKRIFYFIRLHGDDERLWQCRFFVACKTGEVSVSEAVNRNAQCYRGEVCIFNVLYQIDVFWGHDEGITTEAVHNAIKCTVAFRRIQYTDWKQWWYRRNCLSWFIKVGGRILLCRNHVFIHFSIQSAFKYYLTNILAELQGIRDKLLRINVLVTLNKRQVLCCYFQWSKFCKGKGSDAVKERLFLSRREKTTYRIFVCLSNFWGCPGIHSGHDR